MLSPAPSDEIRKPRRKNAPALGRMEREQLFELIEDEHRPQRLVVDVGPNSASLKNRHSSVVTSTAVQSTPCVTSR